MIRRCFLFLLPRCLEGAFDRAGGLLLAGLAVAGNAHAASAPPSAPPALRREFRGVWVASVSNINWPSKPGLAAADQRRELTALLDRAAALKLNAVILQVRPGCDALYDSPYEPWSEYLTGAMGKAPDPPYDPLEYAVAQTHARGLELHAWVNPFRARHSSGKSAVSNDHVSRTHPDWVVAYGNQSWLDPGQQAVRQHSIRVILDIVRRYDIDGVHLDDYFYPYRIRDRAGQPIDFPDDRSWRAFELGGGGLDRADWRRKNINQFVEDLYQAVKAAKRSVKVGLSPFGIWRNRVPQGIEGLDAFEELYADSRWWIANGWADYFAPQLYWPISARQQSFPVLLDWWSKQNSLGRHLWPGLNAARVGTQWPAGEIVQQVGIIRKQPGATGHIYWNIKPLERQNGALSTAVTQQLYSDAALVPASSWLDSQPPAPPRCQIEDGSVRWSPAGSEPVRWWVVQALRGKTWMTEVLPRTCRSWSPSKTGGQLRVNRIAVSAVDQAGNSCPPVVLAWP